MPKKRKSNRIPVFKDSDKMLLVDIMMMFKQALGQDTEGVRYVQISDTLIESYFDRLKELHPYPTGTADSDINCCSPFFVLTR